MATVMDDEPPRLRLVLSDNFTVGMTRAAAAAAVLVRRLNVPAHPLDRIDPDVDGPQTWSGDGA